MSYRILTTDEYAAFEIAERLIYGAHSYNYAWSDVRDRNDSEALAALWDDAKSGLEMAAEDADGEDAAFILRETARRVAVAQYYVLLGELPANAEQLPDLTAVEGYSELPHS